MKKVIILLLAVMFVSRTWAQDPFLFVQDSKPPEDRNFRIPLIGEKAPSFTAESTNGTLTFPSDFGNKWKILMSHPQDFTPVCSSEIIELAHLQSDFDKIGVQLVVVSVDPVATHLQWKKAMEGLAYKDNRPVTIQFPLVGDADLKISKLYGMIHPESNTTRDVRGVYIIDPQNTIEAIYFYPSKVGRSTDELMRTITALQTTSAEKVMTPVNWKAGNDLLIPYVPDAKSSSEELASQGIYNRAWFMWYKKPSPVF